MSVVAVVIQYAMGRELPGAQLALRATRLAASIGGGLVALAIVAKLLRVDELDEATAMLLGRVRKLLSR